MRSSALARPRWQIRPLVRLAALRALVVVMSVGLGAQQAHAQQVAAPPELTALDLEYRAALESYSAALAARRVVEGEWRTALDSVTAARVTGDQGRFDQASSAFLNLTAEFDRLDERVRGAQAELDARREALLEGLDAQSRDLVAQAADASDRQRREALLARVRDLQNQYGEVFRDAEGSLAPTPVFYPGSLAYNPRDTPDLLRAKAQLVERRIEAVSAQLAEANGRIDEIERIVRLRRQQQNFDAPLDRFGDVQLPVVTTTENTAEGRASSDGDTTGARPLTLEEQLTSWQRQRDQLEVLLSQLQENLRRFRQQLGDAPGPSSRGGGSDR